MLDGKIQRQRIRIIIGVVSLAGLLVIARLFSLQIVHNTLYSERAEHQYITPTNSIFDRGNIYFTNKTGTTVAAATIATGFKVAIAPSQIKDEEKTYEALNAIFALDRDMFMSKAGRKSDPYEEIAEHISQEDAEAITNLKLPGVSLIRQKWRFYPGGTLASKAIGFVSYKGKNLVGNYGLEEYYNDVLSKDSNDFYVNFFAEIFANIQSTIFKNRTASGDIVTSIEPAVQVELEHAVASIEKSWQSDAVGGIVMDPYTGEIIAMAAVPTFDLNTYGTEKDVSVYNNPLSQNVYEMGSIVKPLVMAAGIDTGVVSPSTTYHDAGFVVINDKTISNFDKRGRGTATRQDVLNQS
jgi:stage V sporulation protein D (sporulation-specific penicillin-binding protein)